MNEYVTTGDGSITLLDSETGELYHNRAGAYTEALHSYFDPSGAIVKVIATHQLTLLDVCFGLGYNTFVLLEKLIEADATGIVEVIAIETDERVIRATRDVLQSVSFTKLREFFGSVDFAARFHQVAMTFGGLQISIDIRQADVRRAVPLLNKHFDLVFHDPFSPRKVPELWTVDLFRQYHRLLERRKGAILTYSAAGAVRGGLRQAGFTVYRTTPVGEKKGGTLASVEALAVPPEGVQNLSDEELAKLASKSGIPYRDPSFSAPRDAILRERESEQST